VRLFFIFFITVYILANVYVCERAISGFGISGTKTVLILRVIIAALAVITILSKMLERAIVSPLLDPAILISSYWSGIIAIAVTVFVLNDIAILLNYLFIKAPAFKFYSTLSAVCLTVILILWGIFTTLPSQVKIKKLNFKYPALKTEKFTITAIADIHITRLTKKSCITPIIEKVNALNSDIIVINGDLKDFDLKNTYENLGFSKLSAKYGIYAVSGNHEYYTGITDFVETLKRFNVRVLNNETVTINDTVNLAGLPDPTARRFGFEAPNIEKTLTGINAELPTIFLAHQPEIFDEASGKIFLQLSAHTHAGQIPPANIIRKFFFKYYCGNYEQNGSYMYLTSGTRFWGPPLRIFSPCEIVQIIIER
jgi:predicted MPP superfamily phosphohydrolase